METLKHRINSGEVCPYCFMETEYVDSDIIYGKSYGMIYYCKSCDAYVGVHKGTDISLGRLANRELRDARKYAHYHFDQTINKINKIYPKFIPNTSNRGKAYLWLSKKMNISIDDCHIGLFGMEQCEQAVRIVVDELKKYAKLPEFLKITK